MTQSFCQKCRWQTTPKLAHTLDPTSWSWPTRLSRQSVGTCQGNELTRNLSPLGNTQLHSSRLTECQWTNSGVKSTISVHELISALKKNWKGEKSTGICLLKVLRCLSHFWDSYKCHEFPFGICRTWCFCFASFAKKPQRFCSVYNCCCCFRNTAVLLTGEVSSVLLWCQQKCYAVLLCFWQEKCLQCCCAVNISVYNVAVLLTEVFTMLLCCW